MTGLKVQTFDCRNRSMVRLRTRELKAGESYAYTLKVKGKLDEDQQISLNGKLSEWERQIVVRAGERRVVSMAPPSKDTVVALTDTPVKWVQGSARNRMAPADAVAGR